MQTKNNQPAPNNLNIKTRRAKRSHVRLFGTVRYFAKAVKGRIVDVSVDGIALDLSGPISADTGSRVRVECDEIGVLDGIIRWLRNGRVGIEFDPTSNASAKVAAYFRFFHTEVKPVLRR